jgi:uncharacterized protein YoxC
MGIEPAVYGGFMAIVAIVTVAWKLMGFIKSHVEQEIKPVKDSIQDMKTTVSVHEARAKLSEEQFNGFRLEVARTYTTKEDVFNATRPIMESMDRLTHSVDNMNTRIDRVIEQSNAAKPPVRRAAAK